MQSKAATVEQYLGELPDDRRQAIIAIRDTIRKNLPSGYQEGMQYGMIGFYVPHTVYPPGYHCDPKQPLPFACLASQKNHIALYLAAAYMIPELESWFRDAWTKAGKKLDMGKSCVRFKKLDDVPLDVVGEAIRRVPVSKLIEHYEAALSQMKSGPSRKPAAKKKKAPAKKAAPKKVAARKPAAKKKAKPKSASQGKKKATVSAKKKKSTVAARRK